MNILTLGEGGRLVFSICILKILDHSPIICFSKYLVFIALLVFEKLHLILLETHFLGFELSGISPVPEMGTQLTFTCLKSTIETLEKGVKLIQS